MYMPFLRLYTWKNLPDLNEKKGKTFPYLQAIHFRGKWLKVFYLVEEHLFQPPLGDRH